MAGGVHAGGCVPPLQDRRRRIEPNTLRAGESVGQRAVTYDIYSERPKG